MRRLLAALIADVGPLRRSAEFRLLFAGQLVSMTGTMLTTVAVPYQVYEITRSSLLVGVLSLLQFVPYLALGMFGGALADAVDRRRMVRITEGLLAGTSAVLVANASLRHPRLGPVLAATVVMAALDALQRPSLDALLPRVVDASDLDAATALSTVRTTVGMVAGPALAGVMIAAAGVVSVYGIDVASFLFSLLMLSRMQAVPPPVGVAGGGCGAGGAGARGSLVRIAEGFRYARSRPDLLGTYAIDIAAMFFGMPEALFPQLAGHLGGATALGLLFTAPAVGALVVSVTSGWVRLVQRKGLVLCGAACGWGVGIVALGLAGRLWLALVALGFAGAMDAVSGLMRSTIWNATIPDALRGRLAGIEMLSYTSGPLLGNFEGGVAEALGGLRFAITSGGVACVAATLAIAAAVPALRRPSGVPAGAP